MRPPLGSSDLKHNEVNRQHQLLSPQIYPKITLTIDVKLHEEEKKEEVVEGQLLKKDLSKQIEKIITPNQKLQKIQKTKIIVDNNQLNSDNSAFELTSHNYNYQKPPPPPPPPIFNHNNQNNNNQILNQEKYYFNIKKSTEFDQDKSLLNSNKISFIDLRRTTTTTTQQPTTSGAAATLSSVDAASLIESTKSKPTQIECLCSAEKDKKRKSLDLEYASSSLNSLFSSSSDENVNNDSAKFIINYQKVSPSIHSLNSDNNNNIKNVAPSALENEPLLSNYSRQNKSNISLKIFKGEIHKTQKTSSSVDVEKSSLISNYNNHNTRRTSERSHKPSRHLSTLYQQQQRHSLQFIYKTNSDTEEHFLINDNHNKVITLLPPQHTKSQDQFLLSADNIPCNTTAAATRKQHAYSWYAPVYSALEEEFDQSSRVSEILYNIADPLLTRIFFFNFQM